MKPKRAFAYILIALTSLLGTSCNRAEKKAAEERKKALQLEHKTAMENMRQLKPGETYIFKFKSDGNWHPAPLAALIGDHLRIKASGAAQMISGSMIEFQIGTSKQILSEKTDFVVSQPGPMRFRIKLKRAPDYLSEVEVEISRLP